MISKEELEKWAFQLNMDGDCDATDKDIETLINQMLKTMEELEKAKRCLPVDKELEVRGSWIGSVQNYIAHLEESLKDATAYIEKLREWNAGLAQESFERQERIVELTAGKVGNALLERENHHTEVVGHLVDLIIELKAKLSESSESESDRNPILAYADSYRDMAKQGVESVPIWSVITDLERNIAPLYRHTQPAPVVPENCVTAEHRRVIEMLLSVCGAAFELADDSCQQDVDGEDCHVVPDDAFQKLSDALDEIENTLPTEDIDRPDVFLAWSAMPRAALKSLLHAQPAPDYFASLVSAARVRADKAMRKFPQPNYVLNKVAEESGEVIKAVIHYTEGREEWSNVEAEIIDNLAMLLRLVKEGDQVIGFTPPDACRAAMLNGGKS